MSQSIKTILYLHHDIEFELPVWKLIPQQINFSHLQYKLKMSPDTDRLKKELGDENLEEAPPLFYSHGTRDHRILYELLENLKKNKFFKFKLDGKKIPEEKHFFQVQSVLLPSVGKVVKRNIMTTIDPQDIVPPTKGQNSGTVIFLHGSGGTGSLSKEWLEMLKHEIAFPHLKILFPTAPLRPYTPLNGELSNVWFNRIRISPDCPEHLETLSSACEDLKQIVQQEIDSGIPANRIVIGGFSMGGAMSLHIGYRITPQIAGVFALSSFLNKNSLVYQELQEKKSPKLPQLFYTQGDRDDLVLFKWADDTFKQLQSYGVEGQFMMKKGAFHELKKKEVDEVWKWITELVPEQ